MVLWLSCWSPGKVYLKYRMSLQTERYITFERYVEGDYFIVPSFVYYVLGRTFIHINFHSCDLYLGHQINSHYICCSSRLKDFGIFLHPLFFFLTQSYFSSHTWILCMHNRVWEDLKSRLENEDDQFFAPVPRKVHLFLRDCTEIWLDSSG